MTFRNPDLRESFRQLTDARRNMRRLETVIYDLKEALRELDERAFVSFVMGVLCSLDNRNSQLFDKLDSPMMQMEYLLDVYYSIGRRSPKMSVDAERWTKITTLLQEIEMNYFVSMGFSNNGDFFHDDRDAKVAVAMQSYMFHFSNGKLSYDEQTLWRLEHYCAPFDRIVSEEFGFTIAEAVSFVKHLSSVYNDRLNAHVHKMADRYGYYQNHPEEWTELATGWLAKGLPPEKWWEQPELSELAKLMSTNPGEFFMSKAERLCDETLSPENNQRLIEFFRYRSEHHPDKTVYYGAERTYARYPLILTEHDVAVPHIKFLLEALYTRVDRFLCKHPKYGKKYKEHKDDTLEQKVLSLFRRLFGRDAHYYSNYSVDGRSEQDILIEYKGVYIVVEVKDCNFREPMRDCLKAFEKIRKDFSSAVQKGYEQCRRVEDILAGDAPVRITDGKTFRRELHTVSPKRIRGVHSIVVTQHNYGPIQTDVSQLLHVEDDRDCPWSVCVDDLEAFILLLGKKFRKGASRRFLNYLELREPFHGHLLCFDELELCGLYICRPEQFARLGTEEETVATFAGMSDIFDAYYHVGLGFENELNIEFKKTYPMPPYARDFDVHPTSLADVI